MSLFHAFVDLRAGSGWGSVRGSMSAWMRGAAGGGGVPVTGGVRPGTAAAAVPAEASAEPVVAGAE